MNKHIEITKENDVAKLTIKGRAKTAVSTEDLKPIEESLEQLSMKFIVREFRLSANHILGEIFGDWIKELKIVELTDYFLPVRCWHVLSKCGWELGFVSTKRFPAPLPDFVTLAECAYEKRGGIETDPWYEYQKERRAV